MSFMHLMTLILPKNTAFLWLLETFFSLPCFSPKIYLLHFSNSTLIDAKLLEEIRTLSPSAPWNFEFMMSNRLSKHIRKSEIEWASENSGILRSWQTSKDLATLLIRTWVANLTFTLFFTNSGYHNFWNLRIKMKISLTSLVPLFMMIYIEL